MDVTTDEGNVFIGGMDVSISGSRIVAGADNIDSTGAVFLYTKENDKWQVNSKIFAGDLNTGDGFGFGAAVSNDAVIIGAPFSDGDASNAGTVYVYDENSITSVKPFLTQNRPDRFTLLQNYPNPFNPVTTIRYHLPLSGDVNLSIYNILGQKVATLISENQVAGSYNMQWDATAYSSGVYFYVMQAAGTVQTRKLMLLK